MPPFLAATDQPHWTIEFDDRARRELRKLDPSIQDEILSYLRKRIAPAANPKQLGKPLRLKLAGLWRYRVGDYRLICRFEVDRLVVFIVKIAHRRKVYED